MTSPGPDGGDDERTAGPPFARAVVLVVAAFAFGLGVSELGLRLLRDPALPVSVWWPLTGFAVAVLARLRPSSWPPVLLGMGTGQFLANLSTYYAEPANALGVLSAALSEVVVISALLRRSFPRGVLLDSPVAALRFAFGGAGGVVTGASVFTLVQAGGFELWNGFVRSHFLGLLMVSPLFLVSPGARSLLTEVRRHRLNLEWAAQFTVLTLLTSGVFLTDQRVVPTFICAVPLIWGGLRLGPLRAMVSLLAMALVTTVGTLRGIGPVVQEPPAAQTLAVQVVLLSATLCTLFVVLAADEKTRLLRLSRAGSADLVEAERIAGMGSSAWDLTTGEIRWTDGLYEHLGRSREDMPPNAEAYVGTIHPDDRGVVVSALSKVPDGADVPNMQFRLQRPDGGERIVMVRNRVDRDSAGRAVGLRSTVLDVTAMRDAENALHRAHQHLEGVLDAVEDVAIFGVSAQTGLVDSFSRGAETILGWRADEVVGVHRPTIFHSRADQERSMAETGIQDPLFAIGAALQQGSGSHRWTCVRKDGSEFTARVSLSAVLAPDGTPQTYVSAVVDLTRVLRAESDLKESEDRFRLSFDFAPMAMAIVALDDGDPGRIMRVNPALCRFTARNGPDLLGRRLADLMTPAHAARAATDLRELLATGGDSTTTERAFHRGDGGELWGLLSTSVVRPADGRPPYLITMIEDITARMQLTERLRHEASHDPLTGLPNRQVLNRRLGDALGAPGTVAVLYVDLDGFKAVNDRLGHAAGDDLLVQVAERIAGCVRGSDVVARLGGDEFAVLLPRVGYLETARAIGERIVHTLAEPFTVEGSSCRIGASIGIALSGPQDTPDAVPHLLNAADEAMYEAKRAGRGRVEVSGR
ncbi:diguanylate cyclase domain-containing protein [Kineosporia succinea]|uniref:Diguanylate cyclase (GGDEF)-like protein/PAS domain S-box-containing protein n=1 Tax=Kineosporia succinea TaxID=84632 RepID=A0ABT9P7N9_9ACTN|nr:diguanylate cyclase [Kineosporia succinea]MDP9828709.1 diguanylate cyclase (GGDEF)-like protein/PAS domain S-box-containing protein [Kineosporia succinea]